ncbi:uncharacterized protein LOC134565196 [Prinia subflava]|uniref:uncharacterized protein LOC134565196 n=1 Tax=Prinia subflava TaxID=208062 RepID=UPI002FE1A561
MFKGKVPSTHHATNATWSKWIALITQHAQIGKLNRPGILEVITNWPEGESFSLTGEEGEEQVACAEEAPPYNQLPAEDTRYALFTDGSCRLVGMNRKWKAAVWSPTPQVAQAIEGEGGSSQLAELKAVQLALDIAEAEKWPKLYLYTDSWMVANALWGWLKRWKEANWQRRGKPIWAAEEWKDIATRLEKLPVKVCHVDAHVPRSRANEEQQNNQQFVLSVAEPLPRLLASGLLLALGCFAGFALLLSAFCLLFCHFSAFVFPLLSFLPSLKTSDLLRALISGTSREHPPESAPERSFGTLPSRHCSPSLELVKTFAVISDCFPCVGKCFCFFFPLFLNKQVFSTFSSEEIPPEPGGGGGSCGILS